MKQEKLQTKLFRAYFSLACLVLICFAAFSYIFVSRQLLSSQIHAITTQNSSFASQVDASIENLDAVSVNINYSNISKHILDDSFNLTITNTMLTDMADLFLSISGTELKADQINLYDFSGRVLRVGYSTNVRQAEVSQLAWIEKAKELGGSKLLTLPYETDIYSLNAKYTQWFLSLYRCFTNQYGRVVGVIETVKQCKSIFKSVISYEKKHKGASTKICIFDKDGALVYPYDITPDEAAQLTPYYAATLDLPSGSKIRTDAARSPEYIAREVSSYSGYTFLTIQPESAIFAPVYRLLLMMLGVVAFFLLVTGWISYHLSRSVVRPIKHLKHIIQRIELDTLGQERATAYPVSVNELDELYQAFQHMSDSLKDSMTQLVEAKDQELKSRTLALQTQMNPHFYYNTLSSIMILAENGSNDEVIQMCKNLSHIMRYITNTSDATVTLREELDYVEKYLYCMKVRYQTSLNYTLDVADSLLDEKVPKLIIQPLVENAIKYGSNCPPPWHITVRGYLTEDGWQVDVTDSGSGFTPQAIEKITGNIKKAQENPGMPELHINGLGTLNVYLRWKLFCKDDIIFTYGNTEQGHGIVSIGRRIS